MALFASTLYPQTNPTNPVLLDLRSNLAHDRSLKIHPSETIEDSLIMCERSFWGINEAYDSQLDHARRVLTRLAALAG